MRQMAKSIWESIQNITKKIFSQKTANGLKTFANQTFKILGKGAKIAKDGTQKGYQATLKAHQEGRFERFFRSVQHFFVRLFSALAFGWNIKLLRYSVLVIVGFILIMNKDLYLNFNLKSPLQPKATVEEVPVEKETEPPAVPIEMPKPEKIADKVEIEVSLFDEIPTHLLRNFPTQADSNLANTFSNLGFIMNPGLAKKLKVSSRVVALKKQKCQAYINHFAPIAVEEMKKYGVPASITLAQGLLESNVGDSKLAKRNNNHFGIKCFKTSCKVGHCTNYTDDSHKDFFRKYDSDWESYREHSEFLQKKRYVHLKKHGKDYKKWAHGLRKAGYATDKKYGPKLIKIIEMLELYEYDKKV